MDDDGRARHDGPPARGALAAAGRPQWSGPGSPTASASPCARCAATSGACASSATRSLADTGAAGGYRLGAGGRTMPPLMLDRDEAVAVAVCLRSTATESIDGGGEAAIRPSASSSSCCRRRCAARSATIGSMTTRLGDRGLPCQPDMLVTITRAAATASGLRVRYQRRRAPRPTHARPTASSAPPALVPRRARSRPGRLAHVPRRPDDDRRAPPATASSSTTRPTPWRSCRRRSPRSRTASGPGSSSPRRSTSRRRTGAADVGRAGRDRRRPHDAHDRRRHLDLLTYHLLRLDVDFRSTSRRPARVRRRRPAAASPRPSPTLIRAGAASAP